MARPLLAVAVVACCAACAAPGRAERIGTRADGGSIMLSANNDKAWEQARELMSSHCDGRYRVVAQVQESTRGPGGPPPATPGAMADPMGSAGAPFGTRIDYECTATGLPLPSMTPGKE
ncbi:MAG: hypothetical protein WB493_10030 [Anaeromyxobacteraceae bacterium]